MPRVLIWRKTNLNDYFSVLRRVAANKTLVYAAALIFLILSGDTLWPLLGHMLHVLIDVAHLAFEYFMELAFGLSKRQSQVIFFYSELFVGITLSWHLLRKAYVAALRTYADIKANWLSKAGAAKFAIVIRVMLLLGSLSLGSVDVLPKNLINIFQLDILKRSFFNVIPARMAVIYEPRMTSFHLDAIIH